ncbi:MAG: desulfoferrodoxin [Bacteroides sp.]|nr:desulfoferrodoxin [Prevotella sp.]MCM1406919.1 desulfoferrodoxin [Treponema brennaborense]MCM1470070.1 desulfoferrodoxin [Bacteroides sp.]
MKFFMCVHCGNLVCSIENSGVPLVCCGETMIELKPGTSDGILEKHLPAIHESGSRVTVSVGSLPHPMKTEHYIMWIAVETKHGFQFVRLKPGNIPEAKFVLEDDSLVAAYEYCNVHGLYVAKKEAAL